MQVLVLQARPLLLGCLFLGLFRELAKREGFSIGHYIIPF